MTKKPEDLNTGKLPAAQDFDSEPPRGNRAAIARQFPGLIQSGVLLPSGDFRPGHLEHVVSQWRNNPALAEQHFADDLAYIRAAMPEALR